MIWTSLKKHLRIIELFCILLIIGIIAGWIYYQKIIIHSNILLVFNRYSFNLYHVFFYILIVAFNLVYVGPFIWSFNVFLEGFAIGLTISYYFLKYKLYGLIFALLQIVMVKTIYFIIILFLGIYIFKYLSYKNKSIDIKYTYLKQIAILFIILLINELFITNIGNPIINYFSFLIK